VPEDSRTRAELAAENEALQGKLARIAHLLETAGDLISEVDEEGRLLFISPNSEAMLGYRPEDLIGLSVSDTAISENIHPDDRASLMHSYSGVMESGVGSWLEYRYRRADGSWCWLEVRGHAYRTVEGALRVVTVARDIDARVNAQRELEESEARYRVLVSAAYDLIAELDAEGRVLFVSPSAEEILGYKPEQLIGTTPFNLLHPADVEPLADAFLARLVAEGKPGLGRVFRVSHRDGSWRWLQGGGVNYETASGELRVVAITRDITERVRAEEERKRLEEWARQAQKLESLGVMARGVAHDFNNLLTPILGDASLALSDLPPDSPTRARLEKIQKAAHHAASLTNQMLDYAGAGQLAPEAVNLSQLVLEMGRLLESAISKRAVLRYDLDADLPIVQADPAQISQVMMNLITNASEAIEEGERSEGRISVSSGVVDADRELLEATLLGSGLREGRYVYFEVQDDGPGMDPETSNRIFDPFFSTKFTGRGLGLAAVLGIVRSHHGTIEIDAALERGTRIRVLFPLLDPELPASVAARPIEVDWTGRGTVLVADDDEGARTFTSEVLERAGFKVVRASDGREAVEQFRAHSEEIVIVLLDRTMPAAGGEVAFREISALEPDVRIVLVSGYSEESTARLFAGRGFAGFLQKPFLPEVLLEKVGQVLAG
jgi:two-component system cell cycle sensor histidine kinase/response regulator CckA